MTRSPKTRTLINSAVVLACSMSFGAFAVPDPTVPAGRIIRPYALHNEQGDVAPMSDPRNPCRQGTPWFSGIGILQYGWSSDALGVSPDGLFVVGASTGFDADNNSAAYLHAVAWNACNGLRTLPGTPSDAYWSTAYAISNSGRHVAGSVGMSHDTAGLWANMTDGVVGLDNPDLGAYQQTIAKGVSADGTTFAGTAFDARGSEAFIYTLDAPQALMLGNLPGGAEASEANAISNFGNAVVGRSSSSRGNEAFLWTADAGMIPLGDLPGGAFDSNATAVSDDGSVVVGFATTASGVEAFRWTAQAGMVSLGELPGGEHFSEALGVSADGSVIVGRSGSDQGDEAFIWTQANGMRTIRQVAIAQLPEEFSLWQLTASRAVSADGTVIVGSGINPQGAPEGWVIELPAGCPADWNHDSVVNTSDLFNFLDAFFVGDADFTGDSVTNTSDFFAFLNAFFAGC